MITKKTMLGTIRTHVKPGLGITLWRKQDSGDIKPNRTMNKTQLKPQALQREANPVAGLIGTF